MTPLPLVLAAQIPFFLFMALVPPERRAVPRTIRLVLGAVLSVGCAAWGGWLIHAATGRAGRMWIGLAIVGAILTFAPLPRWMIAREDDRY